MGASVLRAGAVVGEGGPHCLGMLVSCCLIHGLWFHQNKDKATCIRVLLLPRFKRSCCYLTVLILMHSLTHLSSLTHSITHSFIHSFTHSLILTQSLVHSLPHLSLPHSLTHSFIHSLLPSLPHAYSLTHSISHSSLTHRSCHPHKHLSPPLPSRTTTAAAATATAVHHGNRRRIKLTVLVLSSGSEVVLLLPIPTARRSSSGNHPSRSLHKGRRARRQSALDVRSIGATRDSLLGGGTVHWTHEDSAHGGAAKVPGLLHRAIVFAAGF
jgi:hypothetical protein